MTWPSWTVTSTILEPLTLTEMAQVAAAAIRGYSDDRPVDSRLVRSRLFRPSDHAEPVVYLARDRATHLVGWTALRPRDHHESHARLWGPVVALNHRNQGIGTALLSSVLNHQGTAGVVTTDVPHDRPGATKFFQNQGWASLEDRAVLRLAHSGMNTAAVRPNLNNAVFSGDHSELDDFIGRSATAHGAIAPSLASTVLARWEQDHRFRHELVLGHPEHPCLLLLLPQDATGASELLFAELWAHDECVNDLVAVGVQIMEDLGYAEARVVIDAKRRGLFEALSFRTTGNTTQFVPSKVGK